MAETEVSGLGRTVFLRYRDRHKALKARAYKMGGINTAAVFLFWDTAAFYVECCFGSFRRILITQKEV